jgi:hypothetical protein
MSFPTKISQIYLKSPNDTVVKLESTDSNKLSTNAVAGFEAENLFYKDSTAAVKDVRTVFDDVQTKFSEDANTASAATAAVATDLLAEVTRATDAENVLIGNLDATNATVATNATTATNATGAVAANLSSEISRALSAESLLGDRITNAAIDTGILVNDEQARAEGVEGVIAGDLTAEVSRATTAEGILDGRIDTAETTADTNADTKVAVEKSRAEAAELVLTDAVQVNASDIAANESAINSQVQGLDVRIQELERVLAEIVNDHA